MTHKKIESKGDLCLKSEFRTRLSDVLNIAKKYDGSGDKYNKLLFALINFEIWVNTNINLLELDKFDCSNVFKNFSEDCENRMSFVLSFAQEKFNKHLDKVFDAFISEKYIESLFLERTDYKLVSDLYINKDDVDVLKEDILFKRAFKSLLFSLESIGIYLDDIKFVKSLSDILNFHEESFYILDIEKINKEIIISNLSQSSTLVLNGILSKEYLFNMTTKDLKNKFLKDSFLIKQKNQKQWLKSLINKIYSPLHIYNKIDLNRLEKVKSEIKCIFPSFEDFKSLKIQSHNPDQITRSSFNIMGFKNLNELSEFFCIIGDAVNDNDVFFELAQRIYGFENII